MFRTCCIVFTVLTLQPGVAPRRLQAQEVRAASEPGPAAQGPPVVSPKPHNVLAWPLYVRWEFENGNRVRMLGPVSLAWHSRRQDASFLVFPTTGVAQFASGRSEYRLAWPLASWARDPSSGYEDVRLAGRLVEFERRSDPSGSGLRAYPFFAREQSASGARRLEIVPFVYRSDDPGSGRHVTEFGYVPLAGGQGLSLYRSWSGLRDRGWNAALLLGGRESGQSRALWIPPYFSMDRAAGPNAPVHVRTLLPVFASMSSRRESWWDFAGVYGAGRGPGTRWLSMPPYFSLTTRGGTDSVTNVRALLPVYGSWRTPQREITAALPSYWRYRSPSLSASGAWPFYTWFKETRADSGGHAGGSVAWPLFTWGRGGAYRALGLLPFYYRLRDGAASLTLAPPVFASHQRPGLDERILVPLYLRRWTRADSLEAFALYYRRSGGGTTASGIFPFCGRMRSPDTRLDYVNPLYYHRRDALGERWAGFPGWGEWRVNATGQRTRVVGPVVTTTGPRSRGFGIVPLGYTGSGPSGTSAMLGPVYWDHGRDGSRHVTVIPLAWYSRSRGGAELHLLPLTGYGRRSDGRSQLYVLWPLYRRQVRADGSRQSDVLLWLGHDATRGPKRRAWLQPLVYYDRPSPESSYLALLGGALSSYERNGRDRTLRVLFVPVRRWRE